MNIDDIEVSPLAAESLGVRSLCTLVRTPDVSILFDPSAALAKRYGLEPHPFEYLALQSSLERIRAAVEVTDIISISHYHYDHVRPGFTNYLYNLSTQDERNSPIHKLSPMVPLVVLSAMFLLQLSNIVEKGFCSLLTFKDQSLEIPYRIFYLKTLQ
jgi:hypothetical protein